MLDDARADNQENDFEHMRPSCVSSPMVECGLFAVLMTSTQRENRGTQLWSSTYCIAGVTRRSDGPVLEKLGLHTISSQGLVKDEHCVFYSLRRLARGNPVTHGEYA